MERDEEGIARLRVIAARTLGHYDQNADSFREGTRDHDVSQNIDALLDAIGRPAPLRILDLGCGPGRDLATFRALGHVAVGLDGCPAFVSMARADTGCDVMHQSLFDLELAGLELDGVFANASLFHVPTALLQDVLARVRAALIPGGVLFCSNPRAFTSDEEGWHGERYGAYLTVDRWTAELQSAGFEVLRSYLRPEGKTPAQQPWVALVARKTG